MPAASQIEVIIANRSQIGGRQVVVGVDVPLEPYLGAKKVVVSGSNSKTGLYVNRRDFMKLALLGIAAGAATLAGCAPQQEEYNFPDELIETYYPELIGKKKIESFKVFTNSYMQVVNFDPSVKLEPLGIQSLLSYYQQNIAGNDFKYKDINENIIDVYAQDRTHKKQLLFVVPDAVDYPRPFWTIDNIVKAQTSVFADREQSMTYIRIPVGPDIPTGTRILGAECAQMTMAAVTDSSLNLVYNMDEPFNNGLGGAVEAKLVYGLSYPDMVTYLSQARVGGKENQQMPFILSEELYNLIPPIQPITL